MTVNRNLASGAAGVKIVKEASFGSGGSILNALGLLAKKGKSVATQIREELAVDAHRPDRAEYAARQGKLAPSDFGLPCEALLTTDALTANTLDTLAECAMGATPGLTSAGLACQAGSTATKLVLADANHGLSFGDILPLNGEYVGVVGVSGADVFIDPPLQTAPNAGDTLGQALQFPLGDTQPTFAKFDLSDLMAMYSKGCAVNDFSIDFDGNAIANLAFNGKAASVTQMIATTLAADMNNVATATITCMTTEFDFLFAGLHVNLGGENALLINSVNTSTGEVSLTRTEAQAKWQTHLAGAEITPHWPATAFDPQQAAQGRSAFVTVNVGGRKAFNFQKFSFKLNNNVTHLIKEGNSDVATGLEFGKRQIDVTLESSLNQADFEYFRKMENNETMSVMAVVKVPNKTYGLALFIPNAKIKATADTSETTQKIKLDLVIDPPKETVGNTDVINGEMRLARF